MDKSFIGIDLQAQASRISNVPYTAYQEGHRGYKRKTISPYPVSSRRINLCHQVESQFLLRLILGNCQDVIDKHVIQWPGLLLIKG